MGVIRGTDVSRNVGTTRTGLALKDDGEVLEISHRSRVQRNVSAGGEKQENTSQKSKRIQGAHCRTLGTPQGQESCASSRGHATFPLRLDPKTMLRAVSFRKLLMGLARRLRYCASSRL